jgi:hypothetical protein
MKKLSIIYALAILVSACNLFENKEKKAIEICQKAKVQSESDDAFTNLVLSEYGHKNDETWLDFADNIAKQDPNKKYEWKAKITDEADKYIVSFEDENNWGYNWEVDIEQQTVIDIDQNDYLSRKYGFSQLDPDKNFEITNITIDTLKMERQVLYSSSSEHYENVKAVIFEIKASVVNKTGKTLTDAKISGKLQVIFKDKTIEGKGNSDDFDEGEGRFKTIISKSKPWNPNSERGFFIKTKGIEDIYLDYEPEYVVFDVELDAKDPIGYSFNKCIEEYDLKDKWKSLK